MEIQLGIFLLMAKCRVIAADIKSHTPRAGSPLLCKDFPALNPTD